LMLALLSACANWRAPTPTVIPVTPLKASISASTPVAVAPGPETAAAAIASANDEYDAASPLLPKSELTPELLYGILASEIAAQRGSLGSAALTDLDLAKITHDPRLAERATQFALASGNLPVATDALSYWSKLDPSSVTAQAQLIIIRLRAGQLAQSQPLIDTLLKDKPDQAAPLFVQLARLMPVQTDKAQAYRLVDNLAARYPDMPEARLALICAADETGNMAVVSREFDTLARIAPQWDFPVAWQVEWLRKSHLDDALQFLQKELARRPQASLELKMAYPRLLVGAKRFVEARQGFEALLAQNPGQPDLLYGAGLLAFQLNDLASANQELRAALAAGYPDADFIRFSLGQIAENQQDLNDARQWYQQVARGPQYLPAQVRLAVLEAQAGELDGAMTRLAPLGSTNEERVQLVLLQSEFAREAKRYDKAEVLLTQALRHYPHTPELLYERALIMDLRNEVPGAERDLRALLKLQPNDDQSLNALGYILANRTARYQEAYVLIAKALKLAPDNPMIIDSMGWVLYKQGHLEQALSYLQRAYAALPDQEVAAHYGEVLWKLGRQQDARALWSKAAQAGGAHPELDETMHRLLAQ